MNLNPLAADLLGVLVGGAIADMLTDVFALVSGGLTVGGACGTLYALLQARRRRRDRPAIDWSGDRAVDWQAGAAVGGAIGAAAGLLLGILDTILVG